MTDREIMQQALEYIKETYDFCVVMQQPKEREEQLLKALEAALAQPDQKPVDIHCPSCLHSFSIVPVAKREWVGLTDDEINKIVDLNTSDDGGFDIWCDGIAVASIVCAKLKEKNT